MLGIGKEGAILSKAVWVDSDSEVNISADVEIKGLAVAVSGRMGRGSGRAKVLWFQKCAEQFRGTAKEWCGRSRGIGGEGRFVAVQTSKGHGKDLGFALNRTGGQSSVSSREVT